MRDSAAIHLKLLQVTYYIVNTCFGSNLTGTVLSLLVFTFRVVR